MDKEKIVKKGFIFFIPMLLLFNAPLSMEKENESIVILASSSDVFYALIATPIAIINSAPLLIFEGNMTPRQMSFISSYNAEKIISVGSHITCSYPKKEFVGNASEISMDIAMELYHTKKAVLIPYDMRYYNLSLIATQIACYEKIPLIVYEDERIGKELREAGIEDIISIAPLNISEFNVTLLGSEEALYSYMEGMENFSYAVVTNPYDAIQQQPIRKERVEKKGHINNLKVIFLAKEIDILGNDSQFFSIYVPDGFNNVRIYINLSSSMDGIPHVISAYIYRGKELITYSFSNAYEEEKCYLEFPAINAEGNYTLKVSIYRGIKGGFFSQRGISIVDVDFDVTEIISTFSMPYMPSIPVSSLSSYLACSRHGIVMPVENEIMSPMLKNLSIAGGAWNNPGMQKYVNERVNETLQKIERVTERHHLSLSYIALLGDVNMLPRYYYKSSTGDSYIGYGIPSDNPYSFNFSVAVGRITGMNMEDVSLMISRELFYDCLVGDWLRKFNFITGEGFGETAAIFHQIPYSRELKKEGFETHLYGIFRNGREKLEKENAFHAGFVEYEGHGDWYWMLSSIYGFDYYSKVVDVAHVKNYALPPNTILTAACLMGRMDGIPAESSISMAFIHAGSVAMVAATRETGGEATLKIIENEILFNNSCIGKAVIKSNSITDEPTKYARVLYGDPAFIPLPP